MLELKLSTSEVFDEESNRFIKKEEKIVRLEHSLVTLSKWESKHKKPYLSDHEKHRKTQDETLDYLRIMVQDPIDYDIVPYLTDDQVLEISSYISDTHTATTIHQPKSPTRINREIITSELVYYWMVSLNIPFETQHWHLNRLITLIQVINHKNTPAKKTPASKLASQRRSLNAQRKAKYGTNG